MLSRLIVCAAGIALAKPSCPLPTRLEWMHLQDASEGFEDKAPEIQTRLEAVAEYLETASVFTTVRHGFAAFVDKPRLPMGFEGDYCVQILAGLRPRDTATSEFAFSNVRLGSGSDVKESQLDALYRTVSSREVGWSVDSKVPTLKLVTLWTDSSFHVKGDAKKAGVLLPRFRKDRSLSTCDESEYVSVLELADLLELENVYVLFVVPKRLVPLYEKLLTGLGGFGSVVSEEDVFAAKIAPEIVESFVTGCVAAAVPHANFVSPGDSFGFEFKKCANGRPVAMPVSAVFLGHAKQLEECSHIVQTEGGEEFVAAIWNPARGDSHFACYGSSEVLGGDSQDFLGCEFVESVIEEP